MLKRTPLFHTLLLSAFLHGGALVLYSKPVRYILIPSSSPSKLSVIALTKKIPPSAQISQKPSAPTLKNIPSEPQEWLSDPFSPEAAVSIFHDSATLTTRPTPTEPIELAGISTSTSITGSANINVMIDATGSVVEIAIIDSSLDEDAEFLAINAIKRTQFLPGRINGVAVPSRIWVQIDFEATQAS